MPLPGARIPIIRSFGTAPPLRRVEFDLAKTELITRTGIAEGLREGSGGDFSFSLTVEGPFWRHKPTGPFFSL